MKALCLLLAVGVPSMWAVTIHSATLFANYSVDCQHPSTKLYRPCRVTVNDLIEFVQGMPLPELHYGEEMQPSLDDNNYDGIEGEEDRDAT